MQFTSRVLVKSACYKETQRILFKQAAMADPYPYTPEEFRDSRTDAERRQLARASQPAVDPGSMPTIDRVRDRDLRAGQERARQGYAAAQGPGALGDYYARNLPDWAFQSKLEDARTPNKSNQIPYARGQEPTFTHQPKARNFGATWDRMQDPNSGYSSVNIAKMQQLAVGHANASLDAAKQQSAAGQQVNPDWLKKQPFKTFQDVMADKEVWENVRKNYTYQPPAMTGKLHTHPAARPDMFKAQTTITGRDGKPKTFNYETNMAPMGQPGEQMPANPTPAVAAKPVNPKPAATVAAAPKPMKAIV